MNYTRATSSGRHIESRGIRLIVKSKSGSRKKIKDALRVLEILEMITPK